MNFRNSGLDCKPDTEEESHGVKGMKWKACISSPHKKNIGILSKKQNYAKTHLPKILDLKRYEILNKWWKREKMESNFV